MSTLDLRSATLKLVEAVVDLVGTARSDPLYGERRARTLELCRAAVLASVREAENRECASTPTTVPRDLGRRIAELREHGMGVRAIARQLGVNASTVCRRLRRAQHLVARPTRIPS